MAIFDRDVGRVVVRVVYTGPPGVGKSTNVRTLANSLRARRHGEMLSPGSSGGASTEFFDWLEIDGGLVLGHPIHCQLLTTPGAYAFGKRRRLLIESADAIVLVLEASLQGMIDGRAFLEAHSLRGSTKPLVVQLNKQDTADAMDQGEVRLRLELDESVPIIAARAADGTGVRETVVLAMRNAAVVAQTAMLAKGGIEAISAPAETADALHERLKPLGESIPAPRLPDVPLPSPEIPAGGIWPSTTGRDIVRRALAGGVCVQRHDLAGQHGLADGSGASDTIILQAGSYCLKTSQRRHFSTFEAARDALVRTARLKRMLGELLPGDTVLCLASDGDNGTWLWTISPWLSTLRSRMLQADDDEDAAIDALRHFAAAAVDAMLLASRQSLILDLHPSNFALDGKRVVYVDDDVGIGANHPALGYALIQRIEECAHAPRRVEAYLDALERGITSRLHREDIEKLGLPRALEDVVIRVPSARESVDRLRTIVGAKT
ncbi:GTPase domain-containing protein [Pendulispora brunnea]|uniref:GTPase domain-containing protein n=1 Tax=Pendulispora brunnea TaxID=2905690 RepID=A0ABZ2K3H5_9BACT